MNPCGGLLTEYEVSETVSVDGVRELVMALFVVE